MSPMEIRDWRLGFLACPSPSLPTPPFNLGDICPDSAAPRPWRRPGAVLHWKQSMPRSARDRRREPSNDRAGLFLLRPGLLQHGPGHPSGGRTRNGSAASPRPAPVGRFRSAARIQRVARNVSPFGAAPIPARGDSGMAGLPAGPAGLLFPLLGGFLRLPPGAG